MSTLRDRLTVMLDEHAGRRYSASALLSLFVHALLGAYLAIASFIQPEVLEIREITLIDRTLKPKQMALKIGSQARKKRVGPPERIKTNSVAGSPQGHAERTSESIGSRIERLRNLSDVVAPSGSGITLAQADPSEVLEVVGLPKRGAPIQLSSSKPIELNRKKPPRLGLDSPLEAGTGDSFGSTLKELRSPSTGLGLKSGSERNNPGGGGIQVASGGDGSNVYITGALSSREILRKHVPEFPRWAKRQGVGAKISLQFTVMANGRVKENIVVVRTSGSGDWDATVVSALRKWQFAPLSNTIENQTGTITFQFVIN